MNRKYHTGSIHVVIVICLAAALIAALTFIFLQNFVLRPADQNAATQNATTGSTQTTNTQKTAPAVKLVDGSIDKDFGTTLAFKYPEAWKYDSSISGDKSATWVQNISLTSPSETFIVRYQVGTRGGIGGACGQIDTGLIATTAYEALPGFADMSYAEYSMKDSPTAKPATYWAMGLYKTETVKTVKPGDSVCSIYLNNTYILSTEKSVGLLNANVDISGVTTADQFKAALTGVEYEQAKAILLSTTH